MAPKWNYFCSVSDVLDSTTHSIMGDGAELRLENDATIVVWGTPLRWTRPQKIVDLLREAGQRYRVRLSTTDEVYGIHIDVHRTLFEDALTSREAFAGEITLTRLLSTRLHDVYRVTPRRFIPHVSSRQCRRRITLWQKHALDWMWGLEEMAGRDMKLRPGMHIPNSSHVFSPRHNMFINIQHDAAENVPVVAGVLTGARSSGKCYVVWTFLQNAAPMREPAMWPHYAQASTLIIVPTHLVGHWTDQMRGGAGGVETLWTAGEVAAWRGTRAAVVIVTYKLMEQLINDFNKSNESTTHARVSTRAAMRKGVLDRTLNVMTWDRIFYDEYGTTESFLLNCMHTHFTWALQGGGTSLDEHHITRSLYPDVYTTGEIVKRVVFTNLPRVTRSPALCLTTHTMQVCPAQARIYAAFGDIVDSAWLAYANSVMDEFWSCPTLDAAKAWRATPPDTSDDSASESDSSDEFAMDLGITFNGVSYMLDDMEDEDEEDEEMEYYGDEQSVADDEVIPCLDYFNAQVEEMKAAPKTCGVCFDQVCDVLIECGHSLCLACAVRVVTPKPARCPHCRYVIGKRQLYMILPEFTPVAHAWLTETLETEAAAGRNVVVVGKDARGLAHLKRVMPTWAKLFVSADEMVGLPYPNIDHAIMLDLSPVPQNLDNSSDSIQVTMLQMVAAPEVEMK